jgi:hypothetical protein
VPPGSDGASPYHPFDALMLAQGRLHSTRCRLLRAGLEHRSMPLRSFSLSFPSAPSHGGSCSPCRLALDRSFHLRPAPDRLRVAPMRTILQLCRSRKSRSRRTISRSIPNKSLDCLLTKSAKMLPFRSPSDQLHVVVLRCRSWETAESLCGAWHPGKGCSAPAIADPSFHHPD